MDSNIQQKPCLVETPQGFSISYNNKFLYSKYAPQKAILQLIESLQILPGTVFLCCSPILPYGLKELSAKLPENCLLLGCEFNQDLFDFTQENIKAFSEIENFTFLTPSELYKLPVLLAGPEVVLSSGFVLSAAGNYRRIIKLDFSAGTQFNGQLYEELSKACVNALMTWWSNRITLTKFGRLYSHNFFHNLKNLPSSTPISNYLRKVSKPIIVCGAGESLNKGIKDFIKNRESYFILCADTALQPLLKHHIIPDGVFIEEAQNIISKAFIGTQKYKVQVFAGLSSLPNISRILPKDNISYFATLYANTTFIEQIKNKGLLQAVNDPFGSVGLTAVYYALQFRKNQQIPVYLYGLDFSYSPGITHTKGAMAENNRIRSSNKLKSLFNFAAAYNAVSQVVQTKNSSNMYSTPTMENYAAMFNSIFEDTSELYDASDSGMILNLPHKKPEVLTDAACSETITKELFSNDYKEEVEKYLEEEKNNLLQIKGLLTGSVKAENLEEEITKLVKPREYLYLHFPDGNQFKYSQSFLNRIRTEIESYLKILN